MEPCNDLEGLIRSGHTLVFIDLRPFLTYFDLAARTGRRFAEGRQPIRSIGVFALAAF
jgi:hypothetical protein